MMSGQVPPGGAEAGRTSLELADWRRRVADLYSSVRERAATDPEAAWDLWRAVREELYRDHPQSPVPAADRAAFRSHHWPYDPAWRLEVEVTLGGDSVPTEAAAASPLGFAAPIALAAPPSPGSAFGLTLELPMSTGEALSFTRLGEVRLSLPAGERTLAVYWMAGYAGGIFLPFRDATNGDSTYGAGRYLLDTAKSADLGGDVAAGRLILDFNFAFHPSCAFDPRWSCPLAPPENRLDIPVEVGERLT